MRSVPPKSYFTTLAFVLPLLYWLYLFFTTESVIVFDSIGYEQLGRMIYLDGWQAFFRAGPNREPLFPLFVALSMRLGDLFSVSYHYPLKVLGMTCLWGTMACSFRLMSLLRIHWAIAVLTVFYMGLSPVLVDSILQVWSEFAAFPFVLLAIFWTIRSWKELNRFSPDAFGVTGAVRYGLMVAFFFFLVTCVKAVAEPVLIFYLAPFYILAVRLGRQRDFQRFKQVVVFFMTVLFVFGGLMNVYKTLNWKYNGYFQFTNRGDSALYGNTVRRMEPLTPRRFWAAVTVVPGMGVCQSVFKGNEECLFWSARHSDDIIDETRREWAARGIPGREQSRMYITISLKKMLSNPLQALALMGIEAHKMFFWESSVTFVLYPRWLEAILRSKEFANTMKASMAFLSWAACVFSFLCLWPRKKKAEPSAAEEKGALFFIFSFVFLYGGVYSIFFIVDRYSFPVVSVYLILIAYMVDKSCKFIGRRLSKGTSA